MEKQPQSDPKHPCSQIQTHVTHCGLTSLVYQLRVTHQGSPDMTLDDFSFHIDDISPECLNSLTSLPVIPSSITPPPPFAAHHYQNS